MTYQIAQGGRTRRGDDEIIFNDEWFDKHEFKDVPKKTFLTTGMAFEVEGQPLDIIDKLYTAIEQRHDKVTVSDKSWKITFQAAGTYEKIDLPQEGNEETEQQTTSAISKDFAAALIALNIYELEEGEKYLVQFTKKQGFIETFNSAVSALQELFAQ